MKLSEINPTPLYDVVIPSTQKKAQYRPFFVKEERALLAAYESEDTSVMLNTLSQVVKNCVKTEQRDFTSFDVEYLFLQIRAKSVGEFSSLIFTCGNCEKPTTMNIDLRAAAVQKLDKQKIITLSDTLSLKMKYPSIDLLVEIESADTDKAIKNIIIGCIETVFVGSESLQVSEEPVEEIQEFLERLTTKQYDQLENFIVNAPTVELNIDWKCPGCGHKNLTELRGINSFF